MEQVTSVKAVLDAATQRLTQAYVQDSRRDAEVLLCHCLQKDRVYVRAFPEVAVASHIQSQFNDLISRREKREPVSRILGTREFWSLGFCVTPDTLVPRPDSETVVEVALACAKKIPGGVSRFVDVGTGTGCLAISLLTELSKACAVATDINEAALDVAVRNAQTHGVIDRFQRHHGSWLTDFSSAHVLDGGLDMVISNPPYIDRSEVLEPEVKRYDPDLALFAENAGLAAYDVLVPQSFGVLRSGAYMVMEIGWQQAQAVTGIARAVGFTDIQVHQDLAGRDRVISGARP